MNSAVHLLKHTKYTNLQLLLTDGSLLLLCHLNLCTSLSWCQLVEKTSGKLKSIQKKRNPSRSQIEKESQVHCEITFSQSGIVNRLNKARRIVANTLPHSLWFALLQLVKLAERAGVTSMLCDGVLSHCFVSNNVAEAGVVWSNGRATVHQSGRPPQGEVGEWQSKEGRGDLEASHGEDTHEKQYVRSHYNLF